MTSLPFLMIGAAVVKAAFHAADLASSPGWGAAAASTGDAATGMQLLKEMHSQEGAEQRIAKAIENNFEAEVRHLAPGRRADLDGVVTEVELLVRDVLKSDNILLAAVRDTDQFEEHLQRAGGPRRANVSAAAERAFNALLNAAAQELVAIVPGSPKFNLAHAKYVMNVLDDISEVAAGIEDGVEDILVLQEESKKMLRDIELRVAGESSWGGAPGRTVYFVNAIPSQAPGYVEREEYTHLCEILDRGDSVTHVTLKGMRGVGKSQMAAQYARRCKEAGWSFVAWINAESAGSPGMGVPSGVETGLADLAAFMGVGDPGASPAERARQVVNLLNSMEPADRLVVLDNLERADDLRGLHLSGSGLRGIVTANHSSGTLGEVIDLRSFSAGQSVKFLKERVPGMTDEEAEQVSKELGCLPVALSQAAATMNSLAGYSPARYLVDLKKESLEGVVDREDGDDYPLPVFTALHMAYTGVLMYMEESGPDIARSAYLQLGALSLMAASGVPRNWLCLVNQEESTEFCARKSLYRLEAHSVVSLSEDGRTASLHRLQSRVIREDMVAKEGALGEMGLVVARLLDAVLCHKTGGCGDVGRQEDVRQVISQLAAIGVQDYSRCVVGSRAIVRCLTRVIDMSHDLGVGVSAAVLGPVVERICSEPPRGVDAESVLICRDHWARIYWLAGDIDGGIKLHESSTDELKRALGPAHYETLCSRSSLGRLYCHAGKVELALKEHEETLREMEGLPSFNLKELLRCQHSLARDYRSAGRIDEAIRLHETTWKKQAEKFGERDTLTLSTSHNLAWDLREAGRYEESVRRFKETLRAREEVLGDGHPHVLITSDGLACTYTAMGCFVKAVELHRWTLSARERVLGPHDPDTLRSRNNLASAYLAAGERSKAVELWEETLRVCRAVLSVNHPLTGEVQRNLVNCKNVTRGEPCR